MDNNDVIKRIGDSIIAFGDKLKRKAIPFMDQSKMKEDEPEVSAQQKSIHDFLEEKRNREPFYKSAHKKKPWE